jgi:cell division protein ZapA
LKEDKMNIARVVVYGQTYQLKGDAPISHMHEVAGWVDQKMNEVAKRNPKLDHTRIAVLAAINIADELLRVKKELVELYEMIGEENEGKNKKGRIE